MLGIPTNPRTQNKDHMIENLNSFDFELSMDEIIELMSFKQDTCDIDPHYYEACTGNIHASRKRIEMLV